MLVSKHYQSDRNDELTAARESRPGLLLWLSFSIFLVFSMVLVGGATRLTESGLSITEWNLVLGVLPPISEAAWVKEFDLYRETSQYVLLNEGMSLSDFKAIYWWEWGHRQLGRFIGLFYLAGFLILVARRSLDRREILILFGVGVLLALQGFVGWIMVASGLRPGMTAVAPVKLTLHLTLACLFFASLIACLVRFCGHSIQPAGHAPRRWARTFLVLVFVQIALGGLVAGYDAGLAYNSWPLMDGAFVPGGLLAIEPAWMNAIDNAKAIQFNHRIGAYILFGLSLVYAIAAYRAGRQGEQTFALILFAIILVQMALGILTLVNLVPIGLALAHQAVGLLLLGVITWQVARLRAI